MDGSLPIIEVTDDNFLTVLPALRKAIASASFLAVDCELTGIGERKKINEPEIDLRYQYTAEVARSHAVIALGLSCFTCKSVSSITVQGTNEGQQVRSHDYLVQTFNVLTLCSGSFTVECKAHKFLLDHGFDFNKLYSKGLQYYKGCDRQPNETPNVRHLFAALVEHKKPVVIHNGLIDLVFLYQSFYAELPRKIETFAADLADMFPSGIYDTKYIAEFHQRLPATYLEYLYKKMQLKNARLSREGEWHVRVKFPPYRRSLPNVEWHPYLQILSYSTEADDDEREMCTVYAFHGWCSKGKACERSHNVNRIVKTLQPVGAKKRCNSNYISNKACLTHIIQNQASKRLEGERDAGGKWDGNSQEGIKNGGNSLKRRKRKGNSSIKAEMEMKKMRPTAEDVATVKDETQEMKIAGKEVSEEKTENKKNNITVKEVSEEKQENENTMREIINNASEEEKQNKVREIINDVTEEKEENETDQEKRSDSSHSCNGSRVVCDVSSVEVKVEEKRMRLTINDVSENRKSLTDPSTTEEKSDSSPATGTISDKSHSATGNILDSSPSSIEKKLDNSSFAAEKKVDNFPSANEKKLDNSFSATKKKLDRFPSASEKKLENFSSATERKSDNSHCSNGHRAGFDAFMTGFIFACHVSKSGTLASEGNPFTPENIGVSEFVNKVYLMGKNFPFLVRTGTYATMSPNHTSKIPKLRKIAVVE